MKKKTIILIIIILLGILLVTPYISDPLKPDPIFNTYKEVSCDVKIKKGWIGTEYIDTYSCSSKSRCFFQFSIVPCVNCGEGTLSLELNQFSGNTGYWVGWGGENTFIVKTCALENRDYQAKLKLISKDNIVVSEKTFDYRT